MNRTMKQEERRPLTILHTNDLHSRLEQAVQMAGLIAQERAGSGDEHVLVFDIGDHMDRMRMETEGSGGQVNVALLNTSRYDACSFGNNEGLTFDRAALAQAYKSAAFPLLCANLVEQSSGIKPPWMQERVLLERAGWRIGITGVTAPYDLFYGLLGWELKDPLEAVARQVAALRSEVDLLIVLSHLGLPADQLLASQVPGIDLILGGHTHHLLETPLQIGETMICGAGKYGEYAGRLTVSWAAEQGKPSITGGCVPLHGLPPHQASCEVLERYHKQSVLNLQRVVAQVPVTLPHPESSGEEMESPLANLLAAGLRRWTGAQIGLVNTGQLLGGLQAGEVTAGELHANCPSPVNPCLMEVKGSQLRQALEQSLLAEFRTMPLKGFGFRGKVLGGLAVDGIEILYNPVGAEMEKLVEVTVKATGELLSDDAWYKIGTIDMFSFGAGYKTLQSGRNMRFWLPEFLRDVLARQLLQCDLLQEAFKSRWHKQKTEH